MRNKIRIIGIDEMSSVEQIKEIKERKKAEAEKIEKEKEKREHKIMANAMKGWSFSEKSIKDMRRLNDESRKDRKEHGALLCGDKNTHKMDLFNDCIGTECTVDIEGDCPNGREHIGTFHTHPLQNLAFFSAPDIPECFHFVCLGNPNAKKGEDLECLILRKNKEKGINKRIEELNYHILLQEHKSSLKDLSVLKQRILDRHKRFRNLSEIINEDYHEFNPDKFVDP